MISIEENEYLTFLSKYFSVPTQVILEKSIEKDIISKEDSGEEIVNKLKAFLGYQRRLLEPLAIAFSKTTPFDTLVKLVAIKNFDNHVSLLIADKENIFKLVLFLKENQKFNFPVDTILKIDACYLQEGTLKTNQVPKEIWFIDFLTFTIKEYFLDNLPECIYDEVYTKKTNIVTIIGYFLTYTTNDKLFCFIYSKELQIRLIPYKLDDLDTGLSTKLVKITYCELDSGPDAYQLKMTEFSDLTVLSKVGYNISSEGFKKLIRFEYPTIRMSLSELTEKSVSCTKVKILSAKSYDSSWKLFGYDSSQAVCITIFDETFTNNLLAYISDETYFLMNGIYKRGRNYYFRERLENIEIIPLDEDEEISIPISKPDQIEEEKLVIIDVFITEILERTYISKENKQERYEKIKALSYNNPITINCYNKEVYQKFLPASSYRLYFVRSKFYNNNLYFIYDSNSFFNPLP